MFKNLFSKKNLPITIAVSVLLVIVIVLITVFSVLLGNSGTTDNSNSNSSSGGYSSSNSSSGNNSSNANYTNQDYTPTNPGNWAKVEYKAMPTLDNVTLTESEVVSKYRGYTDWRIYSIRTAKDEIKPAEGCTAYYVSNRGSTKNDGLSPETPLATINNLEKIKLKLKAGDVIYFERGSVFRGQLLADVAGVTYAAYGEGKKPEIYASPRNAAEKDDWVQTKENKNVYKYCFNLGNDVGTLVFNGGEKHAVKCIIRTEKDGTTYNNTTGDRFDTFADLNENLHFYHDYKETGALYLYCEDGNPGEVFDSIEMCIKSNVIAVKADNVRIDNLCIKYGGAHGIGAGTRNGLKVTNCEFGWIGGSIQGENLYGRNYPVRYGNGVEIYGGCNDFEVSNCYFYQIYDAAATFQYSKSGDSQIVMKNVNFSNNVMEYCNYSIEYFLSGGTPETSYMQDIYFTNNLMWYAGYGLCEQRPNKNADAHIKAWEHTNSLKGEFKINNNLFAFAKAYLVQSNAEVGSNSPTYSGNTYIQFSSGYLGLSGNVQERVAFNKSKIIFVK